MKSATSTDSSDTPMHRFKEWAFELDAVLIDTKDMGKFDHVCRGTVQRIRDALMAESLVSEIGQKNTAGAVPEDRQSAAGGSPAPIRPTPKGSDLVLRLREEAEWFITSPDHPDYAEEQETRSILLEAADALEAQPSPQRRTPEFVPVDFTDWLRSELSAKDIKAIWDRIWDLYDSSDGPKQRRER